MTAIPDRTLLLMRHAKSAWPDVPDHDRPLAPRGRRNAPVMGQWLRTSGHVPDRVVCSTALRARQTWELVQPALGTEPRAAFDDRVYDSSAAGLMNLLRAMPASVRTLLIVGHDPAIPDLARELAETGPSADRNSAAGNGLERMRVKFPTSAIAVFGCAGSWDEFARGRARLARFVIPRELTAPPR